MNSRTVRLVAGNELGRLVRDRKALFFAVVLPILLYPLLFWGSDRLEQVSEQRLEEQSTSVVADLSGLPEDWAAELTAELAENEAVEWSTDALDPLRAALEERERAEALADASDDDAAPAEEDEPVDPVAELFEELEVDLALVGNAPAEGESRPRLYAVYEGADEAGSQGRDRVRDWVRATESTFREARLVELFGGDPGRLYAAETVDVASETDAAGLALGKLLPLIATLVLISGGAFAALEAFAAEREVGTLETLLVQPVDRLDLAHGKFLCVALTAGAAWLANSASFLACGLGGLLGDLDLGGVSSATLIARVGIGAVVFLPTVALAAAVLSVVSARARSYREGQNYLLPVTLIGAALAAPVTAGDVELSLLTALAPVLGPSLAMRDALAGSISALPALVAVLASSGWAWLAIRSVGDTLDAERLLQGGDVAEEAAARRTIGRRATVWGLAGVGGVLLIGSWLQTQSLWYGLAATLWGIALGLALVAARDLSRRSGRPASELLGTRSAGLGSIVGAALLGPALALGAPYLFALQERVLPMPAGDSATFEALGAALAEQPMWLVVFLFAVSPGVCEELLFRGAVFGGLLRDTPRTRALVIQAALFAAAHGSPYRLAVTFLLGLLLGAVRLRSGSILPCILLHATYNGALVLGADASGESVGPDASSTLVLLLGGVLGLVLLWRSSPRDEPAHPA